MMASPEKNTHWQSIFKSQIDSGLTISAFSKQRKINISTYYSWRKRLAEPEPNIIKKQQVVPLFVSESIMPQTSSLMIKTPSGYQLTFDDDISLDKLDQILALIS